MKESYHVPERRLATPKVSIIGLPSGGYLYILSVQRQYGDTPGIGCNFSAANQSIFLKHVTKLVT